jgi:hypothetical protein
VRVEIPACPELDTVFTRDERQVLLCNAFERLVANRNGKPPKVWIRFFLLGVGGPQRQAAQGVDPFFSVRDGWAATASRPRCGSVFFC